MIDTVSRRAEKVDVRAMNLFLHFVGVDPRAKASACTETTRPTLRNYLRMGGGNLRFQPGWRKPLDGAGEDTMLGLSLSRKMEAMTRLAEKRQFTPRHNTPSDKLLKPL